MSSPSIIPRPTSGHHFGELLTCRHKAWLHYRGDFQQQTSVPPFLRALQREGMEHERDIYARLFPGALTISNNLAGHERQRRTFEAMCAGTPIILQGYVATDEGVGVIDILECAAPDAASRTGYVYRVGEIKRSPTLKTAHVLQTAWYAFLLEVLYGQRCREAFFILGDGQRTVVDLDTVQGEFDACKRDLAGLRASTLPPDPFFSTYCYSCPWRAVCLPQLIDTRHLSLLPGITRPDIQHLSTADIVTWEDVAAASPEDLAPAGFDEYRVSRLLSLASGLQQGRPPLRQELRSDVLDNWCVVSLEFPKGTFERGSHPAALHFESGQSPQSITIHINEAGAPVADLSPLQAYNRMALYGGTDIGSFKRLIHAIQPGYSPKILDVLDFIETYVHVPAEGLDPGSLLAYIDRTPGPAAGLLTGRDRLKAVRRILDWIKTSL